MAIIKHRKEIDGLRALAVLPVIFFHAGLGLFSGGFIGVDIFFVISGYLITSIISLEIKAGTFSLLAFYERRVRRILPALTVAVFLCLLLASLWQTPSEIRDFAASVRYLVAFMSNVYFYRTSGYFGADSELKPLLHTWSLSVEEQYYLLFPLLMILLWKFAPRRTPHVLIGLGIVSLGYASYRINADPRAAFFLLPSRIWELLLGSIAAVLVVNGTLKVKANEIGSCLGLLLVLFGIFGFTSETPTPSVYTLAPTIGSVLIILYATETTYVGRFLGSRGPVGLGLISYSAYLFHWPLLVFARHKSMGEPAAWLVAGLIVLALVLAYFCWRYVETPFRQRQLIGNKILLAGASASIACLLSFAVLGKMTNGWLLRGKNEVLVRLEEAKKIPTKRRCKEDGFAGCLLGSPQANPSFALIGDSHARSLVEELEDAAKQLGISGLSFTQLACQPIIGGSRHDEESNGCGQFKKEVFSQIRRKELPPTLIVSARWALIAEKTRFDNKEGGVEKSAPVFWRSSETDKLGHVPALRNAIVETFQLMLTAGYRVILIYPVPAMGWHVPDRLTNLYIKNGLILQRDASIAHAVFSERTKTTYEILDAIPSQPNLIRIKPEEIFCNTFVKERCAAHVDGLPLYSDDDHLSKLGARFLLQKIVKHVTFP